MTADGSVIIDTKISTDGMEKGFERIKNDMGSVADAAEKAGLEINYAFSKIDITKPIANAVARVEALEKELTETARTIDYAAAAGETETNSESVARLVAQQEQLYERLEAARTKLANEISWAAQQQAAAEEKAAKRAADKAKKEAEKKAAAEELSSQRSIKAAEKEAAATAKAAEKEARAMEKAAKRAAAAATKPVVRFGNRLREILSGALIFNAVGVAVRNVVSYFNEALNTNEEYRESLARLKAAFLTAMQPIYEYVLPAVIDLIYWLTNAITVIGQFFAALTGKSYSEMKKNAEALYKQSSAIEDVGNASEEASKQLMGFDEINRLSNPGTGKGETSGEISVNAGSDTVAPDFTSTYGEVPQEIQKLADDIKYLADEAINLLSVAIEGLKPLGEWLWNDFIVPLADFLGFDVEGIESLADALSRLADWIEENSEAINNFLIAVAAIAGIVKVGGWIAKVVGWLSNLFTALNAIGKEGGAWIGKLVSGVKTAWGWISGTLFPAISSALSAIASALGISVGWLVAIIAVVIAAVAAIIIFWDEIKLFFTDTLPKLFKKFQKWLGGILDDAAELFSKAWESIKDFFSPAIEWFSQLWESVSQTFEDIFYNIGVIASGCWEVIKKAWSIASDWFKKTVVEPVANWFSGMWDKLKKGAADAWDGIKEVFSKVGKFFSDTFKAAWEKVKKVFSPFGEIFVNIKDGILKAFKEIVNSLIRGLNNVIAIPFDGINSALKFIKNIEILGLTPFANLRTISVPKIPYLAQGAVIPPNAPFMAVLGDQRNGTNIEAPADLIRQIVREELAGGASNDEIAALLRELIQVVMGIQVGDEVIGKAAARYNRRVSRAGGY